MKGNKSNLMQATVIPVLLTAVIVGIGSYLVFEANQNQSTIATECIKSHTVDQVSFEYPCEWTLGSAEEASTWSATGTVTAPNRKASFTYPAPDVDLHGMTQSKENVTVNGKTYVMDTFVGRDQVLSFVDMGTELSQYGYKFMLASEGTTHSQELLDILSSVKF